MKAISFVYKGHDNFKLYFEDWTLDVFCVIDYIVYYDGVFLSSHLTITNF